MAQSSMELGMPFSLWQGARAPRLPEEWQKDLLPGQCSGHDCCNPEDATDWFVPCGAPWLYQAGWLGLLAQCAPCLASPGHSCQAREVCEHYTRVPVVPLLCAEVFAPPCSCRSSESSSFLENL